jgi:hypothetical protein
VIASYDEVAQRLAEEASLLAASARQPGAAALTKHFAIFRRPVPAPAAIKHLPRRTAIMIARQGYGLNVTEARFVPYPATPGLWVIPGATGVSMVQIAGHRGGGGDNVPVSVALSGGLITTSCCASPGETVWRLVPDGNPTVTAYSPTAPRVGLQHAPRKSYVDELPIATDDGSPSIARWPPSTRMTVPVT